MEKVNLSNITSNSSVDFNINGSYRSAPDGKVQVTITVQKITNGLSTNPQSENNTETYRYLDTPDQVKSQINTDHGIGDKYLEVNTL